MKNKPKYFPEGNKQCDVCDFCDPALGAELKWNSEADEYNQWCELGQDEKDELIAAFVSAQSSCEN